MKKNKTRSVLRSDVVQALNKVLNVANIDDASQNGLQVEGIARITKVGLAVDGCLAASQAAAKAGCQMLVVHHGLIWNRPLPITGAYGRHIRFLLAHDLNLYAAHLPLDIHAVLGNNAGLARLLSLRSRKPFGMYNGLEIGFEGTLPKPRTIKELAAKLDASLGVQSVLLPFGPKKIRSVAVVSGGAAGELGEAVEKGIDCFITGEPDHVCHHQALESGINVIFAGHYHTEKLGVQAAGKWLAQRFGLETVFLDLPTLV